MPALALTLPELMALAGLFLALGMVYMGDTFTRALFQVTESGVGWIPWIGKKAANGVRATGARVNAVFSAAALRLEGAISSTWHVLAALIEMTGDAIWESARVGAQALWLVEVKYPLAVLSALAHKGIDAAGVVTKVYPTTVRRITVTQKVDGATLKRLGRRIARLEARALAVPVLGAAAIALPFPRIGSLERRARSQAGRLTRLERKFGALTFTALVAAALARLGAGWIRCTNTRRAGRALCGLEPNLLEALLGGVLLVSGGMSIRAFALGLEQIGDEAVGAVTGFVREA